MDHFFELRPSRPGFRLHRLEVFNWGTFDSSDGQVYRFEPEGRTSLLVGHNGSGKSTLVDALLTLLVPSNIRNYNVAAGARKTERSEKSYIRGAFGRGSDDAQATLIKYLRPKGNTFSAIAAVFRDELLDKAFTICQLLHLTADGSPDKVFALTDSARALSDDLSGLEHSDGVRDHLKRLGYSTTKKFVEYHGWISKRTQMRSKAMDMFNQTVAVKDIQSLNEFIRRHMLEAHDWRDKVQRLLMHFNDLSVAHQELVRARRAEELLTPVESIGKKYQRQAAELEELQQNVAAGDTFFHCEMIRLYEPELARVEGELASTLATKQRLSEELKRVAERVRTIKNEIEQAGGQRLREIPLLIEHERLSLAPKRQAHDRYHEMLRRCDMEDVVASREAFMAMRERLQAIATQAQAELVRAAGTLEEMLAERGNVRRELRDEEAELRAVSERQTNLPSHLSTLRSQLCADLQLAETALPFVAELISVAPDQRRWEASAEMVLRSFALSLLVPDRFYRRVRAYVEQTKLRDARGLGQRLVYLRVARHEESAQTGDRLQPRSLVRKLQFRSGHDLMPWVRGEIQRRFDYECCESVDEFHEATRLAMTVNRHVKIGTDRHEKDDRPRAVDPRHYVLGWDNREKKRLLVERIAELQKHLDRLDRNVAQTGQRQEHWRARQASAMAALEVSEFDAMDVQRHLDEVAALEREKAELEAANEVVQTLRERLRETESMQDELQHERDDTLRRESTLVRQIEQGKGVIEKARSVVEMAARDGSLTIHEARFEAIRQSLGEPPLSVENVQQRKTDWQRDSTRAIAALHGVLEPLREKLVEAMGRYLREFKEEMDDLSTSVHALPSFLGLLDQLRREDLPRYEKKFKDRLNDKVSQEVALFHGALREECKHIEDKIGQLNEALAQLEYHAGTFMRLEPREVTDREINDFRRSLRECLDDSLENTAEANEARFHRIQRLVERLADKDNTRWRDKVIDVRRWYDFAAREVSSESGETHSYYEDSSGQSGGEKAKLAFTILVAAIAYQYDLDPTGRTPGRFQFVVVDEMFSKVDDQNAEYALRLFEQFGLQLLIVAPLDAKARVTEPYVDCYLHVVKDEGTCRSELYSMTAREYEGLAQRVS